MKGLTALADFAVSLILSAARTRSLTGRRVSRGGLFTVLIALSARARLLVNVFTVLADLAILIFATIVFNRLATGTRRPAARVRPPTASQHPG